MGMKEDTGIYACLDPRGHAPEKPKVRLEAPRPGSLDGKRVWIIVRESIPTVMPEVRDQLLKQVPDIHVLWDPDKQGTRALDTMKEKAAGAVIGVGY